MKKIFVLITAICLGVASSFAQQVKLGHINGQKLVEHMPEYKQAYEELNEYKTQFEEALKQMEAEYQGLIDEFEKNKNVWPKAILETKVKAIEQKRDGIYEFQETASSDVSQKELEKVDPILKKAKEAIEKVAKANGFTYVFDVSTATLLYLGGEDITPLVCKELGIADFSKEPETPQNGAGNGGAAPGPAPAPQKK